MNAEIIQLFDNHVFNLSLGWRSLFPGGKPTIKFSRMFSEDSAKAIKAQKFKELNGINYMSPATFAKKVAKLLNLDGAKLGTVCADSTEGCENLCLGSESGQAAIRKEGELNACMESRVRKTHYFFTETQTYLTEVVYHICKLAEKAARLGLAPCVRLNGASDIPYERMKLNGFGNKTIFEIFPMIQFVDYTKILARLGKEPQNLSLTFSLSEKNAADARRAAELGYNVAVVFAEHLPAWYEIDGHKMPVLNGDEHDLRHTDPRRPGGYIVGLTPKGRKAKADKSGFVVRDHLDLPALEIAA
ncbi:MAG: hypothetical protein VYC35_02830 [Pseudomonadota bacterium]|nr:hypothetical protein [Pseudomonadota bacterium]